ncbi:hypothetical protein KI387_042105, partial [Taxus chinensis]
VRRECGTTRGSGKWRETAQKLLEHLGTVKCARSRSGIFGRNLDSRPIWTGVRWNRKIPDTRLEVFGPNGKARQKCLGTKNARSTRF